MDGLHTVCLLVAVFCRWSLFFSLIIAFSLFLAVFMLSIETHLTFLFLSRSFSLFTLTQSCKISCTTGRPFTLSKRTQIYLSHLLSSVNCSVENGNGSSHESKITSAYFFSWNYTYLSHIWVKYTLYRCQQKQKIGNYCWKETKKRKGMGHGGEPSVMCCSSCQSRSYHPRPSCDCPRISLIPFLVSGKVDRDHPKADLLLWK